VEIKQDFDFFRESFDVVVHTSQHNNERNDTDWHWPQGCNDLQDFIHLFDLRWAKVEAYNG